MIVTGDITSNLIFIKSNNLQEMNRGFKNINYPNSTKIKRLVIIKKSELQGTINHSKQQNGSNNNIEELTK